MNFFYFWRKHYLRLGILFVSSLALCLWFGHGFIALPGQQAIAQTPPEVSAVHDSTTARTQVQQGVERYRMGDFQGAIAAWDTALSAYEAEGNLGNQAIVLENLARAHRSLGDATRALVYWEQATAVYEQQEDTQNVGRMLTEQAQTYTSLGQYRQAIAQLCGTSSACEGSSAVGIARVLGDRSGEAAALGSLGEAYRLQGAYDLAQTTLLDSLAIAQELDNPLYIAAATNSLGSIHARLARISDRRADDALERGDRREATILRQEATEENATALTYFQQSLDTTTQLGNAWGQLRALLNLIPAHHRSGDLGATRSSHTQAARLLSQLSDSRDKAYAIIDLANLLPLTRSLEAVQGSLSGTNCLPTDVRAEAETLLIQAIATAQQIQDYRATSFAAGELGHLYECEQDYPNALLFTQEAEIAADQALQSPDSLYLWQWQTGRILKAQGQIEQAIAAYDKAIATLEKIRGDILTADRDIQFDFRDAVEPIYRQLAELRLNQTPQSEVIPPEDVDTAANVGVALTVLDSLRLAELQNYFGDECVILASIEPATQEVVTDTRDESAAIFSTFILNDRTAIILTLPTGQKRLEWLALGREAINQQLNDFRIGLEESSYSLEEYDPTLAQSLYDQILRPFAADLDAANIQTLVFVQDGIFRSIPMAAFYDGERYLIERYAIATTPSLSLTAQAPPPRRGELRALALGLSESTIVEGRPFAALNGVRVELNRIQEQLPGSQSLLNEEFTRDRLRQELQENEYSIIHMATHGEFGAEPEDTFLVTGDAQRLTINELEAAIRIARGNQAIDLLTLTACKTAIGDDRSALGLAGVAVQAGVRSAIASLWAINDQSTAAIIADFYQALSNPDQSKAQALQAAQVKAITQGDRFSRPGFWAPFILIGDWR